MKLIVGLGNPGPEYAGHRHNIGFMALERIAGKHGAAPWRKKFSALVTDATIGSERAILLMPQTFMNLSGQSVSEAARFYKIAVPDIVVLHDELDLAPGKLRVKTGGSDAGHNGLRSITQHIGADYVRVRLGIGHPGSKERVHGWVLGNFAKADQVWLDRLLDAISAAAPRLADGKFERFQTDVARTMQDDPPPAATPPRDAAPASPPKAPPHPAGERKNKSANAMAENLRKFMEARLKKRED